MRPEHIRIIPRASHVVCPQSVGALLYGRGEPLRDIRDKTRRKILTIQHSPHHTEPGLPDGGE